MARPRTPTALKVLNGSAKHDPQRINKAEPKPELGASPPPFLPKRGVAFEAWKRHTAVLLPLKVLTKADADALALGCLALEEYLDARKVDNWRRADSAWKRYGNMLSWFGLTPSSRTRIQAITGEELDPLEKWEAAQ